MLLDGGAVGLRYASACHHHRNHGSAQFSSAFRSLSFGLRQRHCSQRPIFRFNSCQVLNSRADLGLPRASRAFPSISSSAGGDEDAEGEESAWRMSFRRPEPSCLTGESSSCSKRSSGAVMRNLGMFLGGGWAVGGGAALAAAGEEVAGADGGVVDPNQYLLSFLFFAAFIGLAVLTIGVGYLSVTEFLENREQTKMQKAAEEKRGKVETVKVGNPKGFGSKKVEKKTVKSK